MKPVAIFQHTRVGAPGAIVDILAELGFETQIVRIVDGAAVPEDAGAYAGLVFMGGYMSVHDDLPWIAQETALIRQADALDIPVAGHCLGSQLVARALGAEVRKNDISEIGWNPLVIGDTPLAASWFGKTAGSTELTFQWHGDTFDLPAGAERIASSPYCANQAFVQRGLHMGIQSHLEMTPTLIEVSYEANGAQLLREHAKGNPAVCSAEDLLADMPARTMHMHELLRALYRNWTLNCRQA